MQDIQIETVGNMSQEEKIAFILETMRLCLDLNDFVRARIISKKITKRTISKLPDPVKNPKGYNDMQDLKIKYHKLMIRYFEHERDFLEITKAHISLFETPKVMENEDQWKECLENMVLFVILTPFSNHSHDIMHHIWNEKKLAITFSLRPFREILKLFIEADLINWGQFQKNYGDLLKSHDAFKISPISNPNDEKHGSERMKFLHQRITEHNIRIIARHYTRIRIPRLSHLLGVDDDITEEFISKMVVEKVISAKIDRIDGIIAFKHLPTQFTEEEMLFDASKANQQKISVLATPAHEKVKSAEILAAAQETGVKISDQQILDNWSSSIGITLKLLENSVHIIEKERSLAEAEKMTQKAIQASQKKKKVSTEE